MREYKEETVVQETLSTVTCNMCGNEEDYYNSPFYDELTQGFEIRFPYGSKYDNETWSFDLCDKCLTNLVKTFKYVPKGFKQLGYRYLKTKEQHQEVFDNWKKTEEWEELMFCTYEEVESLAEMGMCKDYLNEYIAKYHCGKPYLKRDE